MNRNLPHLSEIRVLLWDIDGTLIRSRVRGSFKRYFIPAMQRVYGSIGNFEAMQFSGMTDTQIIYESLREEGFTPEQIFARRSDLLDAFRAEMTAFFAEEKAGHHEILPGVFEILRATDRDPLFINALLTGNLSVAAEIKLKSVGLWQFFEDAPNAFGEISHNRNDLSHEAGNLFNLKYEYEFEPRQFIVIGDTPNDIACARHFGARSVAVATGKNHSTAELAAHRPDIILDNLENTAELLKIFRTL